MLCIIFRHVFSSRLKISSDLLYGLSLSVRRQPGATQQETKTNQFLGKVILLFLTL